MNILRHSDIRRTLSAVASFLIPAVGHGQTWRSTLYPENWQRPGESVSFYNDKLIQDFSFAGYKRGEEAIPSIAGPVFNVTTYGADPTGATNSTVAIQNAINAAAAAGGGVVYLPTGEFRISPQGSNNYSLSISTSNIVLRGAGTGQTFLLNTSYLMRGKTVINIQPPSLTTGGIVNITADLPGPTRRIPVANASTFAPGDIVRLEWAFTDEWIAEHNQQPWWNGTDRPANALYLREVITTNPAAGWIEVDIPTRYTMKTRDAAGVRKISGQISGVGVESLAMGNLQHPGTTWAEGDYNVSGKPGYDVHGSLLITVTQARDCWITSVHSRQPAANTTTCHMLSNAIRLSNSFRVSVRNCQLGRPQYGGGGGNGYMYQMSQSNDCLFDNCIADFSRHGFSIASGGTSGNVFFQCQDRNTGRATGSTGSYVTDGSGSDNHMHFSHSNLWDGCLADNSYYTAHHRLTSGTIPHGLTSAHGVYWNTTGSGTRYTNIVVSDQARYGYIIGTSGSKSGATTPSTTATINGVSVNTTAPVDHLEGVNLGATLEPASLYLDQLSRRLLPKLALTGGSIQLPNNTFSIDAALSLDGQPVNEPVTLNWATLSTPPNTRLTSTATPTGRALTVSLPGTYQIEVSGSLANRAFSSTINIEVLPPPGAEEFIDLLPVADSHVQGGTTTETTNSGSATALQIKSTGAVSVHREAFMRFDLSGIATQRIQAATLNLYFTSTSTATTGRTSVVSDNTWGEATINYLNRPTTQTALVGDWGVPAQNWVVVNAGQVVPARVGGNGLITFRQQIITQPASPVYAIASRENATPSLRPFLRIQVSQPTLDEWLAQTSNLQASKRGPLADPDGDGLSNLLEAWLGTDASNTTAGAMPRLAEVNNNIELSMQINATPPGGLVYFVEYSDSLAPDDWHLAPAAVWESSGPEAGGRVPMVVRVPTDPTTMRRFYRVNVQSQ